MHKPFQIIGSFIKNLHLSSYILEELCRQCGRPVPVDNGQDAPSGICLCVSCNLVFTSDKPTDWWLTVDGISPGFGLSPGLRVCTAATYAGPIQKLIRRLKYDDDTLVAKDIGPKLYLAYSQMISRYPGLFGEERITVVPVPLHRKRQIHRGYNQAHLLAGEFARIAKLPVETRMLSRVKETQPQYGLKKGERLANVKDAFALGKFSARGHSIILVDDVFTSGATLLTCASLLSAAGATTVAAIAAARAPFDKDKIAEPSI